jgi:hypothetical protein
MGRDKAEQSAKTSRPGKDRSAAPVSRSPGDSSLASQDRLGNARVERLIRDGTARGEMTVSDPSDRHEHEAERVAALQTRAAMRANSGPPPPVRPVSEPGTASGGHPESAPLIRQLGAGQPLDGPLRSTFEPFLGRDLGGVRIHTSSAARSAARALHADAFTIGSDIGFAAGRWAPDTARGKHLLAHELAHVVQHASDPGSRRVDRQLESGPVSEPSEMAQHMLRQYGRLADLLPFDQWNVLVTAAEDRAARQEAQQTAGGPWLSSIQVPLNMVLDQGARFVDLDIWDTVFNLFYQGDQSQTAGILLRNEIARDWFTTNAVDPQREMVTISLIDPEGVEHGPAQLDFVWRKNSLADRFGAIQLDALDEPLGATLMVRPLRDASADVKRDARALGEGASAKRLKDQLETKLPKVFESGEQLKNVRLAEVAAFQELVETAKASAYAAYQNPRAVAYIPGVYEYYKENASKLFTLLNETRSFRVGAVVRGQQHIPTDREARIQLGFPVVGGTSETEDLYAQGELSLQGKQDLDEALADRIFIMSIVNIALMFATFGVGGWVAEGVGLAEGTLGYTAVQMGTSFALTDVGTMAAEHIVTNLTDINDPVAQAIWRQGAHSVGDYFKAAGLGFVKGATLGLVLGGGFRAYQAYKTWRATLVAAEAEASAIEFSTAALMEARKEPPFTVLSDITDAATNVRTWQLRTINGELVTISASAETGSGYIYNAATGELRQIINGELGGVVRTLGEGAEAGGVASRQLALTAGTEHTQALAELDELLRGALPVVERSPQALADALRAMREGRTTVADLEVIFKEVVVDYRATAVVGTQETQFAGTIPGVLNYRALTGCCGAGRDITAASLAGFVRETGQTAVIRRFQALDLFEIEQTVISEQHAFAVVQFEGLPNELFLVDPTFAQFFQPGMFGTGGPLIPLGPLRLEQIGAGEGIFTGNILKTELEGAQFARDLVRDGFIRLTRDNAPLYVRAMGVPEARVADMTERLMTGERAILTERIGGPEQIGAITEAPIMAPEFMTVEHVLEETRRLMNVARQTGDPFNQLQRLGELETRLDQAIQAGPQWWDVEQHGPFFELTPR